MQRLATLVGHDPTAVVFSVAWAPTGRLLVSACQSCKLILWDAASLSAISHTNQPSAVLSLDWSPDGQHVVSGGADDTVRLWRVPSFVCEHTLTAANPEFAGSFFVPVMSVAWALDGQTIVSGGADCSLKLWKLSQTYWNCERILTGHTDKVAAVAWDSSGRLASGSQDETVRIWSKGKSTCQLILNDHCGGVESVSWSPDDRRLASASCDNTVKLWDVAVEELTITCSMTLKHASLVESVAWSWDGKRLASAGLDGIKLWSSSTGTCKQTMQRGIRAAWSPEGDLVTSGHSGNVSIWTHAVTLASDHMLTKTDLQDCMAAVLCEWLYVLSSEPIAEQMGVPRLAFEGVGCTQGSVELVMHPDLGGGLTSFIVLVLIEFPEVYGVAQHRVLFTIFRGTKELHQWMQNLNIQYNLEAYRAYGLGVHSTFHQEVANRWLLHDEAFRCSFTKALEVIVTGHSQGGAHATAFFGMLKLLRDSERHRFENLRLVTFAAPMVFSLLQDQLQQQQTASSFKIFCQTMMSGRNYMLRNDPVPRAYSCLRIRQYFAILMKESRASLGERAINLLRALPVLGDWVNSAERSIEQVVLPQLQDYEELARGYRHVVEIRLLNSAGRHWRVYDMAYSSFDDHHAHKYVQALSSARTMVSAFLPELSNQSHQQPLS